MKVKRPVEEGEGWSQEHVALHKALLASSQALAAELVDRKVTLALAESCTGGLVSAVLTELSGATAWFEGALVTYRNEAKEQLLHVPHVMLQQHGAVSKEVALAMVGGVLEMTKASWAAAVTGLAGPAGGSASTPVGTVWLAWQNRTRAGEAACHHFSGDRQTVRLRSAGALVDGLRRRLTE